MNPLQVTREQLTRYLVRLHFEFVPAGGDGVEQACAHVRARRSVQFDPIDVVGRNADLVLQSRIDGYRPEMLHQAIYEKHCLYDGYDKNLCIYPVEDFPFFGRMRRNIAAWFRDNEGLREYFPKVLEEIDRRGMLCSDDLPWNEKIRWPWGNSRISRAALESLWMDGTLAIAKRDGVKKYYDRFERCYDAQLLHAPDPNPDDADYFAWQVLRRTSSVGFLTGGASDAFLCVDGMRQTERNEAFQKLIAQEELVEVHAEGVRGFVPAVNVDMLRRNSALEPKVRFLAPLDNLMWDRKLIQRLFGFEYRWEIYVPPEKRRFGYYVLPVMFENQFVARFEAEKFDGSTFRVKNWWWEPGFSGDKLPNGALDAALCRFADFLNAKNIEFL